MKHKQPVPPVQMPENRSLSMGIKRHKHHLLISLVAGFLLAQLIRPLINHFFATESLNLDFLATIILGWDLGVIFFFIDVYILAQHHQGEQREKLFIKTDESTKSTVSIASIAALLSVIAILFLLASSNNESQLTCNLYRVITGITIIVSWCLVSLVFAIHYAYLYYHDLDLTPDEPSLVFADKVTNNQPYSPTYVDFLYFAFTIGTSTATSDITLASKNMRQTVLSQTVLSFIFNSIIVGLSINLIAALL